MGNIILLRSPTAPLGNQASGGNGQLPAGHFTPQRMPMQVIMPRPDAETGSFASTNARHRWAYYDAVNPIQYRIPIEIQGGSRPLWVLSFSGPAGATIGLIYGSANYMVVTWTPTQVYTTGAPAVFSVTFMGQDGSTLAVTWTTATSSTKFIFLDSVNGSNSNNGSFNTPLQTMNAVLGGTATTTTFPGALVYLKAGSYQWPTMTGGTVTGGTQLSVTNVPVCYMAIPGDSVTVDASQTQLYDGGGGATDLWFEGQTINGSSATALDTHTFEMYSNNRATWWNVAFTNPVSRANGSNTNSSSIFSSNSGGIKNYWVYDGCSETGRAAGAGNSMLLTSCFSVQNMLIQNCSAIGTAGFGLFLKDSNRNVTVFNNIINLAVGSGDALLFGCQQNNQSSFNLEASYNYVVGGGFIMDFQSGANAGIQWSDRNTIYRTDTNNTWAMGNFGPSGTGPYFTTNDVLIAKTPGGITTTATVPFTASGTEVQVAWSGSPPPSSNNPINPATGNLVNVAGGTQWRSLYFGIRGKEIG